MPSTFYIILVVLFVAFAVIGFFLIRNVPSLLHTPLMSGMNALSGITVIGAMIMLNQSNNNVLSMLFASLAIILATVNITAGFFVTNRMLKMIVKKSKDKQA